MKNLPFFAVLALLPAALGAQSSGGKVLYVYDEVNDNSRPYIALFEKAFAAEGIAYDALPAAEAKARDLAQYRAIAVHGMVMAFASKSPVRDWLASDPRLEGRKVALFVTANRWFLGKLFGQLEEQLKKDRAETIDAVSAATKKMDAAAKELAVRAFVARLK